MIGKIPLNKAKQLQSEHACFKGNFSLRQIRVSIFIEKAALGATIVLVMRGNLPNVTSSSRVKRQDKGEEGRVYCKS